MMIDILRDGVTVTISTEEEEIFNNSLPDSNSILTVQREKMLVSRAQAIIALDEADMLSEIDDYMNDPGTPQRHKMAWDHDPFWRRTGPMLQQIQTALGWTDEQVDDLFRAAMAIEV